MCTPPNNGPKRHIAFLDDPALIKFSWESLSRSDNDYVLCERTSQQPRPLLAEVKPTGSVRSTIQATIGIQNLMLRQIGHAQPRILVTSDDPLVDGSLLLLANRRNCVFKARDGRDFFWQRTNASINERVCNKSNGEPILRAWRTQPNSHSGVAEGSIRYVDGVLGSVDVPTLYVLCVVDFFLTRLESDVHSML